MYDDGLLIGVPEEECMESIMVLYYMAKSINSSIEVCLVRLGREQYNVQLRATMYIPDAD